MLSAWRATQPVPLNAIRLGSFAAMHLSVVLNLICGLKELISPEAKPKFGEYKRRALWDRSEEDVEWSVNFIKAALNNEDVAEVKAGFVTRSTRITHNAFSDAPPVSSEVKPLLRGFLSRPMDLDEPIPAPGAASSLSGVTEVKQEPQQNTKWKRTLRSIDSSAVIELDSPTPKKQRVETAEASTSRS
eukprot:897367-Amphidinium_carterae.1